MEKGDADVHPEALEPGKRILHRICTMLDDKLRTAIQCSQEVHLATIAIIYYGAIFP